MVLERILELDDCEEVEDLDETERGDRGLGTNTLSNGAEMTDEPDPKKLKQDENVVIQTEI